jgi:hypothetical protein
MKNQARRQLIALKAAWEIDATASQMKARVDSTNVPPSEVAQQFERLQALACVVMSAVGDDVMTPQSLTEQLIEAKSGQTFDTVA